MPIQCNQCAATLAAGSWSCPQCGQRFTQPVPGDPASPPAAAPAAQYFQPGQPPTYPSAAVQPAQPGVYQQQPAQHPSYPAAAMQPGGYPGYAPPPGAGVPRAPFTKTIGFKVLIGIVGIFAIIAYVHHVTQGSKSAQPAKPAIPQPSAPPTPPTPAPTDTPTGQTPAVPPSGQPPAGQPAAPPADPNMAALDKNFTDLYTTITQFSTINQKPNPSDLSWRQSMAQNCTDLQSVVNAGLQIPFPDQYQQAQADYRTGLTDVGYVAAHWPNDIETMNRTDIQVCATDLTTGGGYITKAGKEMPGNPSDSQPGVQFKQ